MQSSLLSIKDWFYIHFLPVVYLFLLQSTVFFFFFFISWCVRHMGRVPWRIPVWRHPCSQCPVKFLSSANCDHFFFFWRRHVSSSNLFSHLMRHVSFVLRHYAVFKKTSVSTSLFTSVSLLFFHGRQSNSIFAILLPFSPRDMPTENDCWGFFFVLFSKKNNQI